MKHCAICRDPLGAEDVRKAAEEVVGFIIRRSAGGANHVMRKQETGRLAHAACAKYGPPEHRTDSLFEEPATNEPPW